MVLLFCGSGNVWGEVFITIFPVPHQGSAGGNDKILPAQQIEKEGQET